MPIEYAVPITQKPHVLHVGLRVTTPEGDVIQETPVRAALYNSLTPAKRLAYAQQAAEYWHPAPGAEGNAKRLARRAAWDADDRAAEEAAAAAVRAAEAAKWSARPLGRTEEGRIVVEVVHGGLALQVHIPADVPDPQQAIRDAWQAGYDRLQAESAALRPFRMMEV